MICKSTEMSNKHDTNKQNLHFITKHDIVLRALNRNEDKQLYKILLKAHCKMECMQILIQHEFIEMITVLMLVMKIVSLTHLYTIVILLNKPQIE